MFNKKISIRFYLIPLVGVAIALLLHLLPENPLHTPIYEGILISIIATFVYWNTGHFIGFYFLEKFPGYKNMLKRCMLMTLVLSILIFMEGSIMWFFFKFYLEVIIKYFYFLLVSFTITIMITLSYEASILFNNWKESLIKEEKLKNQQLISQYQLLKAQMNSHFIFNSLNTLMHLIEENSKKAMQFTQELSDLYRYVLQNEKNLLVEIDEEVIFLKNYLSVLKMRYLNNLKYSIDLNQVEGKIPTLALQILAENAIKHNIVSRASPLNISVFLREDYIVISNNIQLKKTQHSTKIGLGNIQKRYELLYDKTLKIVSNNSHYEVMIPIIRDRNNS